MENNLNVVLELLNITQKDINAAWIKVPWSYGGLIIITL